MKKPSNKAIAVYLTWGLLHLALLLTYTTNYARTRFFPFTEQSSAYQGNWETKYYDITEFAFYMIAPILIYYIVTLFKSNDTTDN